uniref:Uncharacterized protein n=1 Tax=uncultured marine group II/III euryarchaeote KM3_33_H04 TaxID=1456436 RepID=A0A075GYU0_9EURY|nr:hypothetical protein [uncultured marine group II/III euryarchaeote KM3_33_H04]
MVVQEALSSVVAEDSMSRRRSESPAASATPRFANRVEASESTFCSSSSSSGQSGSDIAPMVSATASGNLSDRALASGLILPDWRSCSLSARAPTDLLDDQTISSTTASSESMTLASLQS